MKISLEEYQRDEFGNFNLMCLQNAMTVKIYE